jgi:hypothetical protein
MIVLWIILAVLGLIVVGALGRFLWNLRPQAAMRGLPPTPLERLGWLGLAITLVVGIGMATLVAFQGATGFNEDATSRGIFWILMLAGVGVWVVAWRVANRRHGGAVVDERDRAILARSLSVESMIVLLSLVAWTVVLTEVYWDEGAVPIAYLQLLFWSTFIGGLFGRSLGIVLGYRRETMVDG